MNQPAFQDTETTSEPSGFTLRSVIREVRDYPATVFFSATWILVFLAMLANRWNEAPTLDLWRVVVQGIGDGHRFGDLTLRDLANGEVWRLVTCTFVHYSVIHIALNLLAFYFLGTLLESWYGAPQFVMVYLVTGGVGNLVSAIIRQSTGASMIVHSGGGSVVIMGLIGLFAVVGWRSRTEMGSDLGWQMSKALGITAILGIAFPRYIDNWGHAGGAIVGFPLGFANRFFQRNIDRTLAWAVGVVAACLIAACGAAQYGADLRESEVRRDLSQRLELMLWEFAYRDLRGPLAMGEQGANPGQLALLLEGHDDFLNQVGMRAGYARVRALAREAQDRLLTDAEQAELKGVCKALSDTLRAEVEGRRLREVRRLRPEDRPRS